MFDVLTKSSLRNALIIQNVVVGVMLAAAVVVIIAVARPG